MKKRVKLATTSFNMQIVEVKIPYTDFKRKITEFIRGELQIEWDSIQHYKLYENQRNVNPKINLKKCQ